jgi:hypothetical protein
MQNLAIVHTSFLRFMFNIKKSNNGHMIAAQSFAYCRTDDYTTAGFSLISQAAFSPAFNATRNYCSTIQNISIDTKLLSSLVRNHMLR